MERFRLIDRTPQVKDAKKAAIEAAMEIIGAKLERYAKKNAPVGTPETTKIPHYMGGTLKNSITYVTKIHGGQTIRTDAATAKPTVKNHNGELENVSTDEEDCVIYGTNVHYAPFVELGSSRQKPRPYLKPALEEHIGEYQRILAKVIKSYLGDFAK